MIEGQLPICKCFAKRLADELGVTVYAPKTTIYVYEGGSLKTEGTNGRINAEFNVLYPRNEIK